MKTKAQEENSQEENPIEISSSCPYIKPVEILPFTAADLLLFLLGISVLSFPALLFVRPWLAAIDPISRLFLSLSLGFALHTLFLTWVSPLNMRIYLWIFLLLLLAASAAWLLRPPQPDRPSPFTSQESIFLLLLLSLQFSILLSPLFFSSLPHGNDAVYHVAIVDKLLHTFRTPTDFLPYDPVAPTYTLGSHWLLAFLSEITSLWPHRLYALAMVLFLLLATGLVFSLAQLFFDRKVAFFAALAFAFLCRFGSLDLMRWGSFPNLAGMVFFLGALRAAWLENQRQSLCFTAIYLAALLVTHHLSALVFGMVLLSVGLMSCKQQPTLRPLFWRLTQAFAAAVLFAVPVLFVLAKEVWISLTSSRPAALGAGLPYLNVWEPMIYPWRIPLLFGLLFFLLAGLGIWTAGKRGTKPFLWVWVGTLLGGYVVLDWPVRFGLRLWLGQDLAILTPSRFLTDLAYPLSLFAGLGLHELWLRSRRISWLVIGLAPFLATLTLSSLWKPALPPAALAGLKWFGKNSPPHSLLLQAPKWTTYVSKREEDWMVLREESLSPYTERKRGLAKSGSEGVNAWMKETQRPVYLWDTKELPFHNLAKIWEKEGFFLYQFRLPTS